MQQDKLRVAARHVAAARHIVAKQRAIVARLENSGYAKVESIRALDLFEQTLAIFEKSANLQEQHCTRYELAALIVNTDRGSLEMART